ncbi:MAG: hypothetical protein GC165_07390 [Armatimonadetes bacterium]|nr:hypothetical protein [Armatimonadota bacterium]
MTTIEATKVSNVSLTTTPTKIWASSSARVGIEVHADSSNAGILCLARVPVGTTAPIRPDTELSASQTFEGDARWNTSYDVYWWMSSGTGVGDAKEIQN